MSKPNKVGDWYSYSGAIHMHTTESDGTKPIEEVIAIGRSVPLDFMMLCDHMTLSNRENNHEGIYGKTLVLIGYEHNDRQDKNHYLLFDTPDVYSADMSAAEYVAAGASDNAIGILAHPDEIRNNLKRYPPYEWNEWSATEFTGLELWNQMSEWMEKLTRFNKLAMSLSPRKSMTGPTDRILKKFDELNMTRRCVGIGGVDAHAFPIPVGPITIEIFPYKVHFKCIRSHILLTEPMSKDFETAKRQVYDAIRDCRMFISNMRWGMADRFEFYAESDDGRATCGQDLPSAENCTIRAKLPARATVRLIHNGKKVFETLTDRLEYEISQPGIYRLEAYKGKRGWIFTNHIRIAHIGYKKETT